MSLIQVLSLFQQQLSGVKIDELKQVAVGHKTKTTWKHQRYFHAPTWRICLQIFIQMQNFKGGVSPLNKLLNMYISLSFMQETKLP